MLSWWKDHPHRILAGICVACTLAITILHSTEARYAQAELRVQDWLATNAKARQSPRNPEIVYLGIDKLSRDLDALFPGELEASPTLQLMKKAYPFDREVYAHAIDRLAGAGAKVVALDILFDKPGAGDEALRAALDRQRSKVVIGSNLVQGVDEQGIGEGPLNHRPSYKPPTLTLIPSGSTDDRVGFVNVHEGKDRIVRQVHYRTSLMEFFGYPPVAGSPELFSIAARALQKAGKGDKVPNSRAPQRFRFAEGIFPKSFYEIFVEDQWKAPPYNNGALFKDKIVLIGSSGNESEDRISTPFGLVLGPNIHLSAINAALNDDFLYDLPWWGNLLTIFGGGTIAWLLCAGIRRPVIRLIALGGTALLFYGVAQIAFNSLGVYLLLLSPLLALTTSGITYSAFEQVLEQREKARIRRTFERYVSKDVVMEVLDNPQSFLNSLGGERRPVTILFSDVRGFTTKTESAEPGALVKQLNEYFHEMVRIVRVETRGTLDKFIGDAVMAHWGSIVSQGSKADACSAVAAALKMRAELKRLNEGWAKTGQLHFEIGIGINHGEVIVGNIGSEERAEVSVIGDAVNLASRLEGVTKPYHVDLCLGESVVDLVRDTFIVRSLDLILVQGKTKPVEVFTVLDRRTPDTPEPTWLSAHEQAMHMYRRGEFADATRHWQEVLTQNPGDTVAELFIERCETLMRTPPPQPWTGVWAMKTK